MANYQIKFFCESEVSHCIVEKHKTEKDIIELSVFNTDDNTSNSVWLDKSTAIKFAKTLRTEINKL